MMFSILLINSSAVIILILRGMPTPFPWIHSIALALILLIGGTQAPNGLARGVGFVTLLSAMIVTQYIIRRFNIRIDKLFYAAAILLTAFIVADAFRLFDTPDIAFTAGETFTLVRRPYLLEHPNVKACWLLLLSLSPITLIGILFAQSRGALLGYLAALFRFVSPRFYIPAMIGCLLIIMAAALIRPNTFMGRADIWRDAVTMFLASPFIGHGTGSYRFVTGGPLATAHNAALTIAAENGLIGLTAFSAWLFQTSKLIAASANVAKFNLLAFGVQQLVDDQWLHPVTAMLIGALLAVCLFQDKGLA